LYREVAAHLSAASRRIFPVMLTRKQHELLMFIKHHLDTTGFSPSFDEMKDGLDLKSKSGVHRLITALEERGFLRRRAHRARALEVVRVPSQGNQQPAPSFQGYASPAKADDIFVDHFNIKKIPLLGNIAAGNPIEAISNSDNYIDIPSFMVGTGQHYAIRVTGDSMAGAGILDGDTAIIHAKNTFTNGDIVVALVDKAEVTLKKIRKRGNSVALEPSNPLYETKIFGAERVEVQGILAAIIRSYGK
jgi:repressor LexA